MLISLWDAFVAGKKKPPQQSAPKAQRSAASAPQALPVAEIIGEIPAASTPQRPAKAPALSHAGLSPKEILFYLEARLSALMDSYDTPGWKINPAFHPDVVAFIQSYRTNPNFHQRAVKLQQNRAKYYARTYAQSSYKKTMLMLGKPTALDLPRNGTL